MNDNPYKASIERLKVAKKSMGKMFVVGFLLLALGEAVQVFVRYKSPGILWDMVNAPEGVKPGDVVQQFQFWSWVTVASSVISLVGGALLLYTIWKHLAVPAIDRNTEV